MIWNVEDVSSCLVFGILRLSSPHVCRGPHGIIYIIPLSEHINASDEVMQLEREPSGIPHKACDHPEPGVQNHAIRAIEAHGQS